MYMRCMMHMFFNGCMDKDLTPSSPDLHEQVLWSASVCTHCAHNAVCLAKKGTSMQYPQQRQQLHCTSL